MIQTFRLQNFKCFQDEKLALRALTLIVGANGAGKSSFLQGLLLAHQAANTPASYVRLNGPLGLDLGRAADVLCQAGDARSDLLLEVTHEGGATAAWGLDARSEDDLVLHINRRPSSNERIDLTYLNAERIGPREVLDTDSVPSDAMTVGPRGEFTAQVLVALERTDVIDGLLHPKMSENRKLGKQVEFWMQDIAPGIQIRAISLQETNIRALRLKHGGVSTDWLRPPNIGFGISYVLPIIVAGLLARPGSLFLVENPEAHLHPAGQSQMGRFFGTLAAAGVQVVVETHSDHVLNGVRLAAVDGQHPLHHNQIVVQFFHGDRSVKLHSQAIDVNGRGGLSSWPAGFFDQSEKDLAAILESRRRE